MMTRARILSKPVFQPLVGHPALDAMPIEHLRILDVFFEFLIARGKDHPSAGDVAAWASLHPNDDVAMLEVIRHTFVRLAPGHPVLAIVRGALDRARHRRNFRGQAPKSRLRRYSRKVSIDPGDLPEDWIGTLKRMTMGFRGAIAAPAPSIVGRMTSKLCQFAWSAETAGLPVQLRLEPLRAYYDDLNQRDLRAATWRASWEELHRFARYIGDREAVALLAPTLRILAEREQEELPLKFAKILEAGDTMSMLRRAGRKLDEASSLPKADKRHAARNKAAALALNAAIPLRREWHQVILGRTLTWSPKEGYRLTLVPAKTIQYNPEPYTAVVPANLAIFIDALVLQDHDPEHLDDLRQAVIERRRSLFITYDGTPCAQSTVSRYWAEEIGTGAHVARTMMHDLAVDLAHAGKLRDGQACDPTLLGVQTGMALCHQTAPRTARKYETRQSRKLAMAAAQACVKQLGDDEGFFD